MSPIAAALIAPDLQARIIPPFAADKKAIISDTASRGRAASV